MAWVHGVLAALSLAVGLLHLVRVARRRDVDLEASYAAMGLGMAAMYSPVGDPVPAPAWAALFLLCAGWFGGLMVRARSVAALGGEAMHLVVGSAAMLFMLAADHRAGGSGGGHPAHAAGAPGVAGVASAVAILLAGYFVLHVLRCADRLRVARSAVMARVADPTDGPGRITTALRSPAMEHCERTVPALAHLLMTVVMAVMLVGMI